MQLSQLSNPVANWYGLVMSILLNPFDLQKSVAALNLPFWIIPWPCYLLSHVQDLVGKHCLARWRPFLFCNYVDNSIAGPENVL